MAEAQIQTLAPDKTAVLEAEVHTYTAEDPELLVREIMAVRVTHLVALHIPAEVVAVLAPLVKMLHQNQQVATVALE